MPREDDTETLSRLVTAVAETLSLSFEEARRLLCSAFAEPDCQDSLVSLLGTEQIELISELVQSGRLFADTETVLEEPTYIEHLLPETASAVHREADLLPTSAAGDDRAYFPYARFNPVQSRVFPAAYGSSGNLLVAAPTGAGKTDIALLAILRALREPDAKAVYLAPMKALATEVASKYSAVLGRGRTVIEYTGDTELSAAEANGASVIVSTPEKFDVATRRVATALTGIRLVVIDEIHLLGEDRGPVLEAVVARLFRMSELRQKMIRIVGLSATLPNYGDVGRFIRAEHVFFFDASYRPVPLRIAVVGLKKTSKRADQDRLLTERVEQYRRRRKQVLVFVHSRNRTVSCATMLREALPPCAPPERPLGGKHGTRKPTGFSGAFDQLVQCRIGVHHAGMSRPERLRMESLFRDGRLDVLVCTATLAWGVNLPAHAVIINGTDVYNRAKGQFDSLGILDAVQIFGRAGRPQYDTRGEATLITSASKIDHYIAQLRGTRDIESRLLYNLTDALCAEVYLRNIRSVASALQWLRSTFLYIRMLKHPAAYGLDATTPSEERTETGPSGPRSVRHFSPDEHALTEYILISLKRLESSALISISAEDTRHHGDLRHRHTPDHSRAHKHDHNLWTLSSTEFGRIASLYYLSHRTIHQWLSDLAVPLPGLFFSGHEFRDIALRQDESPCLQTLHRRLFLSRAIDFDYEQTAECKLLLLFHAHINYLAIPLFSLSCDLSFLSDCLQRMVGALREILLFLRQHRSLSELLAFERLFARVTPARTLRGTAQAVRCGPFVELAVAAQGAEHPPRRLLCLVYDGDAIIHGHEFVSSHRVFLRHPSSALRLEIHSLSAWCSLSVPVALDQSMAALYKYGIHSCDALYAPYTLYTLGGPRTDCVHFRTLKRLAAPAGQARVPAHGHIHGPADSSTAAPADSSTATLYCAGDTAYASTAYHVMDLDRGSTAETYNNLLSIDFRLDIRLVQADCPVFRERLALLDSLIYDEPGSLAVVCPFGAAATCATLNTMVALDSTYERMFEVASRSGAGGTACRRVVANFTGLSAASLSASETVIFKGCYDGRAYYPVCEVLRLCHGRRAVIYETREYIEYLGHVISRPHPAY